MTDTGRILLIAPLYLRKTPAFERAAALARATDCALHIVAFDYLEGLATALFVDSAAMEHARQGYLDRHREWLEEQARPMRARGTQVTTEVIWCQNTVEEAVAHAREMDATVVIKDVQHESFLKRTLFTPQDIHLLHECAEPVHFVSTASHSTPRKIVVGVDLYHQPMRTPGLNEALIKQAFKLGEQCNAEVHLLYAFDLTPIDAADEGLGRAGYFYASNLTQELYEQQEAAFNALAERYNTPPENRHLIMGNPGSVLTTFARQYDMDLIMLARVQRTGFAQWLGGTAEQVLYKAPSSVWLI